MNTTLHTWFLTFAGLVASLVGALATFGPEVLLAEVKHAEVSGSAVVMARTAGVLLLCIGGLTLAVRRHPPSPSLEAVMGFGLAVQLALLPIDPAAYRAGVFRELGSFLPNTLLHLVLALGFGASAWAVRRARRGSALHTATPMHP
ncbi:MAG: hypothetical protein H6730_23815 [Deltaproteobacteria bacterium]|nr:hypothetical protein [Deltaproteobacteria bacterium]